MHATLFEEKPNENDLRIERDIDRVGGF